MMTISPARLHLARCAAKQVADQQQNEPKGSEYELMLATLDTQLRSLANIQSHSTRNDMKREYLQGWQPYIETTLAENTGVSDPIISRIWIWLLDTGDIEQSIAVGRYIMAHELPAPEGFGRTTAVIFADEIANAHRHNADSVTSDELMEVVDLLANCDMPDEVRAKLLRASGESLADANPELALGFLSRALTLDAKVGCKKLHDEIERFLQRQSGE